MAEDHVWEITKRDRNNKHVQYKQTAIVYGTPRKAVDWLTATASKREWNKRQKVKQESVLTRQLYFRSGLSSQNERTAAKIEPNQQSLEWNSW